MKSEINTIESIVKKHLCHNCGSCYAICPEGAISMPIDLKKGIYKPTINGELCTNCGMCIDVCSGKGFDFKDGYSRIYGIQPDDPWLGVYLKIVTSNSTDNALRFNASSGGSLTALLISLFDDKIIDGALVTRFNKANPLMPDAFIARNKTDLLDSIGSKYCPVPANMALKEIAEMPGKYAFVGLPCHIQSLRLMHYKKSVYKDRITLIIGLMCSHTNTFNGTKYFLTHKGIESCDTESFAYRGQGWTGSISVLTKDQNLRTFLKAPKDLKKQAIMAASFNFGFVLERCLTCCDHMAEFADIVFGDPRLPEYLRNEHDGKSMVVIRNEKGMAAYQHAITKRLIEDDLCLGRKQFYSGQNLSFKKGYKSHIILNKIIGRSNPEYEFGSTKTSEFNFGRLVYYMPSFFHNKSLQSKVLVQYAIAMNTVFSKKFYVSRIRKLFS